MASTQVPCLVVLSALNASHAELLVCLWGEEMISVVFALPNATVGMIMLFVRTLAIVAGLFILIMLVIAIYAKLHGENNN